jgi:hypothetical protein
MSTTIQRLRDVIPFRPLTVVEAMHFAELQATNLLALSGITGPPVPETIISGIPRIHVERMTPSPVSGATQWSRGRWLMLLNGAEPVSRQRYSMAHEFKHILDHPFIDFLYPTVPGISSEDRAERICDYFAACLLMPRLWVKHLYFDLGLHEPRHLAQRFETSSSAMHVRLLQVVMMEAPTGRLVAAP